MLQIHIQQSSSIRPTLLIQTCDSLKENISLGSVSESENITYRKAVNYFYDLLTFESVCSFLHTGESESIFSPLSLSHLFKPVDASFIIFFTTLLLPQPSLIKARNFFSCNISSTSISISSYKKKPFLLVGASGGQKTRLPALSLFNAALFSIVKREGERIQVTII